MHSGNLWDSGNYSGRVVSSSDPQGFPDYMKVYNRVFVDAKAAGSYPVVVRYNLGRFDLPAPGGGDSSVTTFGEVDGWGEGEWGVAQWGGSGNAGSHIRPDSVRRGTYVRVIVETVSGNQWFQLNGYIVEAEVSARQIAA